MSSDSGYGEDDIQMSPIDKMFGESTGDRFFTLVMVYTVGLTFGFGFWIAYRVVA